MPGSNPCTFGVLIVGDKNEVICATGVARCEDVQQSLIVGIEDIRGTRIGMVSVQGHDGLVAAYRADSESIVFFIRECDQKATIFDFMVAVDFAPAILAYLINSPYESMVVVDAEGKIRFLPPVHEAFFGVKHGEAIGKHVTEVIENTTLHDVVRTGKAEIGCVHHMKGVSRVVSRIPIFDDGRVVGAIGRVMFKEPDAVRALSREVTKLRSEVEFYQNELSGLKERSRSFSLDRIVGQSEAIRQLKADLVKVAPLPVPVLIVGESGTGKELAAHAIHALSPRHENPMVFVNAAALPAGLVESELFGYEAGAFTGAEKRGRKGKFELADGTSLFFDEIGDMPAEIQVKLLRVLQDGVFERVGGDRARYSDFRLVCASNRDFEEMIKTGKFRLDLYYRVSGVTIRMPSLRERLDDIPHLVESFLAVFSARHKMEVRRVHPKVYGYLRELPWPGNVRQLLHEVEKAAIFCDGSELTMNDFRPLLAATPSESHHGTDAASSTIQEAINDLELRMIREAMIKDHGNKRKVAEHLGISRAYLYKKLAEAR